MTGWSKFQQRACFLNPSPTGGDWNLENTGGDFVFYPTTDYASRQIRFRNSGDAVFPKTVSIGNN